MSEHEGLLKMDGYDDCIVGIVERFGQDSYFIYDKDLVIKNLQKMVTCLMKMHLNIMNIINQVLMLERGLQDF